MLIQHRSKSALFLNLFLLLFTQLIYFLLFFLNIIINESLNQIRFKIFLFTDNLFCFFILYLEIGFFGNLFILKLFDLFLLLSFLFKNGLETLMDGLEIGSFGVDNFFGNLVYLGLEGTELKLFLLLRKVFLLLRRFIIIIFLIIQSFKRIIKQ
jgi:hypothetical protein